MGDRSPPALNWEHPRLSLYPRYLVPFTSKRCIHRFTDVLILGGGLAGLRAALACDPSVDVIVATKDKIRQSNSSYAQGGIASVLDPEDRVEWHIRDTLVAGANLCQPAAVQMVIEQGPQCIRDLIAMGAQFDQANGDLTLGREGGHSHNRIIHALGDATGQEIMRAVIDRVRSSPQIAVCEDTFTIDLLTDSQRCWGALVWMDQQLQMIWAHQTILATGGAGQLYRETTNPHVATADGLALAIRAGVEMRDMEFMQFHPTVLYIAGGTRSLITEAMRGEGAHLVDRYGQRFMSEYDSRQELAPRDIVSQAIVTQMEKTHHPCVYLDLSHLEANHIRQRFPGIHQTCAEFGLDITRDRIPVRPGAHYMIGGVAVDLEGRTSLPHLWAAGEVTSSGLHGANRLASNSLLEGVVYGATTGRLASAAVKVARQDFRSFPELSHPQPTTAGRWIDLSDIRNSLKSLMWRAVGVRRNAGDLAQAFDSVSQWLRLVSHEPQSTPEGWELQNMLLVAWLMIQAAEQRTESRGVHFRSDFPAPVESWRRSLCFQDGIWRQSDLLPAPQLASVPG